MIFSEQSPNYICVVTGNGYFKIVDTQKAQELVNVKVHKKIVNSVSCNHSMPFLYLTAGDDGLICLIDINK